MPHHELIDDRMIDSSSMGDPARHLPEDELERRLAALPTAPTDTGRVSLLVRRLEDGRRDMPAEVILRVQEGFPGDAWGRDPDPYPEAQLTVVELGIGRLIANGQPLGLSGDQLFLDLDLSRTNLPTGSRVRVGEALLQVTPKPHNGCRKYRARFGADALRFVSRADLRHRNMRGVYMKVIEEGLVRVGDAVHVVRRGEEVLG